jgi:hypothetical protein
VGGVGQGGPLHIRWGPADSDSPPPSEPAPPSESYTLRNPIPSLGDGEDHAMSQTPDDDVTFRLPGPRRAGPGAQVAAPAVADGHRVDNVVVMVGNSTVAGSDSPGAGSNVDLENESN